MKVHKILLCGDFLQGIREKKLNNFKKPKTRAGICAAISVD